MNPTLARLLGVGSEPFAATGGSVADIGDYRIHTLTSSADFVVTSGSGIVEYLEVGGGGGGGKKAGGGGGGGQVKTGSYFATVGTYPAVIGSGGPGATTQSARGTNGGDTSIFGDTATGGGGGGSNNSGTAAAAQSGASGGNGGGGSRQGTGGTGTQFNGGNGNNTSNTGAGGGGGASAAGANGSGTNGGNGGNGLSSSISGSAVTYGGGGGGGIASTATPGSGGTGGGGAGANGTTAGTAGTANTGGGGGGSGGDGSGDSQGNGGAGGSGIVIIRYLLPSEPPPAPGGDPTTVATGCLLWVDAADSATITQSSGLVSQWDDKSGNANHLTSSGSSRPVTGTRTVNSLNVIDFDGSAQYMAMPSSLYSVLGAGNSSIIALVKFDNTSRSDPLIVGGTGGGLYGLFPRTGNNVETFHNAYGNRVNASWTRDTNLHAFMLTRTTTSFKHWRDGVQIGSTGTAVNITMSFLSLGRSDNPASYFYGDMVICEVAAYDHELTSTEITDLLALWTTKWGL